MVEPVRGAPAARGARRAADRDTRWATGLIVVVLLVPFGALVVWALGHTVYSAGDVALTEALVRSVGTSTTPLVGAYSRSGWHHPGPLLFDALAGPYRMLGADGSALAAAAVVLNALATGVIAYLFWRRDGLAGLVTGSVVVVLFARALGNDFLVSAWNPDAPVLPTLVFVLALWVLLDDRPWMLVVMTVTGSFAVQSHVGTAGVVGAGLVVAIAWLLARRRSRPAGRRVWITAGVAAALLWAAPVLEAARHRGGNLRALLDYWTASHDHLAGWSVGARIVAAQLSVGAPWLTGHETVRAFSERLDPPWRFPVVGLLFVVALVIAARRRDRAALQLGALTVGVALVAWVSAARIVGEPFDYLLRWVRLVGVLAGLSIAWTVLGLVRRLPARVAVVVGVAATAVVVAVAGTMAATSGSTRPAMPADARLMAGLAPALDRHLARLREPVLVGAVEDMGSVGLSDSVWAALRDRGLDARLPRSEAWKVGASRTVRPEHAGSQLVAVVGDRVAGLRADPRYRLLAIFDPLSPRRRAELDRLQPAGRSDAARLRWALAHPAAARRIAALSRHGPRAAIVERRD